MTKELEAKDTKSAPEYQNYLSIQQHRSTTGGTLQYKHCRMLSVKETRGERRCRAGDKTNRSRERTSEEI